MGVVIVYIGGMRNESKEVADLLGLPDRVRNRPARRVSGVAPEPHALTGQRRRELQRGWSCCKTDRSPQSFQTTIISNNRVARQTIQYFRRIMRPAGDIARKQPLKHIK